MLKKLTKILCCVFCFLSISSLQSANAAIITRGYAPTSEQVDDLRTNPVTMDDVVQKFGLPAFEEKDSEAGQETWYYILEIKSAPAILPETSLGGSFVVLVFNAETRLIETADYQQLNFRKLRDCAPSEQHLVCVPYRHKTILPIRKKDLPLLGWQDFSRLVGFEIDKHIKLVEDQLTPADASENVEAETSE